MLKIIIIILGIVSFQSNAGHLARATPSKMYGSTYITFDVDNASASNTCDLWGRTFTFNATTESGKNMLSILLAATLAGKKVDLWFVDSSAPGTDRMNGCNSSTIAVLTSIGLS